MSDKQTPLRFEGKDIWELITLHKEDNTNLEFWDWYANQIALDLAYKKDEILIQKIYKGELKWKDKQLV